MEIPAAPSKGKTVAVIGGGPAGMTVAIILAKNGYDVTIFEEKEKIGGMLQYGIPDFRLPKTVLHWIRLFSASAIRFVPALMTASPALLPELRF